MGKKLLFVNLSKNSHLMNLTVAEAERYGHTVYNLMDFPRESHKSLRHIEYSKPTIRDYKEAIHKLVNRYEIDYVLSQCDNLYPMLDTLDSNVKMIPKMNCKINDLMDKEKFFYFCRKHNIPHPHTIVPTSVEEIIREFDSEIFVKPTNGADGSTRLHMTEEKYSEFDYLKYKNSAHLIDVIQKYDALDEFLNIQKNGKEMKFGKSLAGIRGRHIIQECVSSRECYSISLIVANNKIHFIVVLKTLLPKDVGIFFPAYIYSKQYVIDKREDNYIRAREVLGNSNFETFMSLMYKIIEASNMKLSVLNITFVPYSPNKAYLFDIHFRLAGGVTKEVKVDPNEKKDEHFKRILFKDIEYNSIWEYV